MRIAHNLIIDHFRKNQKNANVLRVAIDFNIFSVIGDEKLNAEKSNNKRSNRRRSYDIL